MILKKILSKFIILSLSQFKTYFNTFILFASRYKQKFYFNVISICYCVHSFSKGVYHELVSDIFFRKVVVTIVLLISTLIITLHLMAYWCPKYMYIESVHPSVLHLIINLDLNTLDVIWTDAQVSQIIELEKQIKTASVTKNASYAIGYAVAVAFWQFWAGAFF